MNRNILFYQPELPMFLEKKYKLSCGVEVIVSHKYNVIISSRSEVDFQCRFVLDWREFYKYNVVISFRSEVDFQSVGLEGIFGGQPSAHGERRPLIEFV